MISRQRAFDIDGVGTKTTTLETINNSNAGAVSIATAAVNIRSRPVPCIWVPVKVDGLGQ
jgi:hypothetical protein